jgi:CheY-like chemotaxis protein
MPPLSVLIVEDEAIPALYLRAVLEASYRVAAIARSGAEAVEIARREMPDIILMDIRLEGPMDGIEAARRIKAFSDPRILFCSAYSDADAGNPVGLGLGEALLEKPIDKARLLAILGAADREP